jgi:hypothetical protein
MELDVDESECIVTLDQVRKIFDEANRETCYYITEVKYLIHITIYVVTKQFLIIFYLSRVTKYGMHIEILK